METGTIIAIVVIVLILIILAVLAAMYNGLVKSRNFVDNAWSQIDVQLKRRYDLIPNLVETVKGYASHEKETLENVIAARNATMNATSPHAKAEASNMLTSTLKSLFAVAENYPDLKANTNFQDLQKQLKDTEDKIAYARQFYNDTVTKYNNEIQTIPRNIVAKIGGFEKKELFDAGPDEVREAPKVQF
ncbi:Protein LemA [Methanimicrococcus sp. At1]|uniref:Protein LemA n=1 Tax=Methanimicrococcus hacksteinii TaxID=3028293 RepID=A0ABU3VPL9_9EURY|nr:LemA family protein [Methanimicrococcus sp. At1]MDV0445362.1 Protein LemA [Methanimicrococcus sp. At1]